MHSREHFVRLKAIHDTIFNYMNRILCPYKQNKHICKTQYIFVLNKTTMTHILMHMLKYTYLYKYFEGIFPFSKLISRVVHLHSYVSLIQSHA